MCGDIETLSMNINKKHSTIYYITEVGESTHPGISKFHRFLNIPMFISPCFGNRAYIITNLIVLGQLDEYGFTIEQLTEYIDSFRIGFNPCYEKVRIRLNF